MFGVQEHALYKKHIDFCYHICFAFVRWFSCPDSSVQVNIIRSIFFVGGERIDITNLVQNNSMVSIRVRNKAEGKKKNRLFYQLILTLVVCLETISRGDG